MFIVNANSNITITEFEQETEKALMELKERVIGIYNDLYMEVFLSDDEAQREEAKDRLKKTLTNFSIMRENMNVAKIVYFDEPNINKTAKLKEYSERVFAMSGIVDNVAKISANMDWSRQFAKESIDDAINEIDKNIQEVKNNDILSDQQKTEKVSELTIAKIETVEQANKWKKEYEKDFVEELIFQGSQEVEKILAQQNEEQ